MDDSPIIVPVPELSRAKRAALIIATTRHDDHALRELRSPGRDAEELAAVLGDPLIGGFTVTTVVDQTDAHIRLEIAEFLDGRKQDETVLVYLSCHGIQDQSGRLHFAATNTRKARPRATAVKSSDVLDELDECRARQQILILDCCFSGAFGDGGKGEPDLERQLVGHGRGRVVLTASRSYEYSYEGKPLDKPKPVGSVFTTGLVEGLRSGAADSDGDGYIAWDEAFGYADRYVQITGAKQTPQQWLSGGEGAKIILARSPAGRAVTPAKLPEDLATSLASGSEHVRIGAVNAVTEWLSDPDPARSLAATRALREVADHDNPRVAAVARAQLDRMRPAASPVSASGSGITSDVQAIAAYLEEPADGISQPISAGAGEDSFRAKQRSDRELTSANDADGDHLIPDVPVDSYISPGESRSGYSAQHRAGTANTGRQGSHLHKVSVGRLLISLAGASPDIMRYFPLERAKYVGQGSLILAAAAMAGFSVAFALRMVLMPSVEIVAFVGIMAGLFVMVLDRWLIVSISRRRNPFGIMATLLPRLMVGLVLGVIIAEPLVLQIFRPEIDQQIIAIQDQRAETYFTQLNDSAVNVAINRNRTEIASLENIINNPTKQSESAVAMARAELPAAERALQVDQTEQSDLTANFERQNSYGSGLLLRIGAMNNLISQNETIRVAGLLLFILFMLIGLLPILMRLLLSIGPVSAYEKAVFSDEEIGLRIAEIMQQRQLRRVMEEGDHSQDHNNPTTLTGGGMSS